MCHSRALNNKLNRLHERCLRLIYNDKRSTFEQLLDKDNSVSIHIRNLQTLAIEMYKVVNGSSPLIMNEIFQLREQSRYNLRHQNTFKIPSVNTVYNGTETVSFLGPKLWELIPAKIKELGSLKSFKKAIKNWKPERCPCRICKPYIQHVGFIS